jgi:serine/alanine adding enzyme
MSSIAPNQVMLMLKEVLYTTDDWSSWRSTLPIQESVFGSVEFATIVQRYRGQKAALYVLQDRNSLIAYPFFFRSIRSPFFGPELDGHLSDTVSPEFTGPIAPGGSLQSFANEFPRRFSTFASNQRIVTEFIHLHPWKAFTVALLRECLQFNREIAYVDLTWPEQQLWRTSFSHACRKNINRSQREHVRVFEAQTMGDIRDFHRLYTQTMNSRNALKHYYYSLDYFSAIFEQLRGSARFVLAEYKNQMVAGTLYLHDRDDVYSYLGGADMNFQHVRPTNAVIYDTILWGKQEGKRRLILGGGYLPNDGIFRFKSSFSPERARFFVYKRVHLPEQYAALCRYWSRTYGQDSQAVAYFPTYRFLPNSKSPPDLCRTAAAVVE